MAPELFGTGETANDEVLDGARARSIGNTGSSVLDLEALFARVDFARTVFTADVFDGRDEGAVDSLALGGAATTRVEGGEEVEALGLE